MLANISTSKIILWRPCVFSSQYIFILSDLLPVFPRYINYIHIYIYIHTYIYIVTTTSQKNQSQADFTLALPQQLINSVTNFVGLQQVWEAIWECMGLMSMQKKGFCYKCGKTCKGEADLRSQCMLTGALYWIEETVFFCKVLCIYIYI